MPLRPKPNNRVFPLFSGNAASWGVNLTGGTYFKVYAVGSVIWGAEHYCAIDIGSPVTLRFKLYKPSSDVACAVKDVIVPANSPGFYTAEFDDVDVGNGVKLTITDADLVLQGSTGVVWDDAFCISVRETTGVYGSRSLSAVTMTTRTISHLQGFSVDQDTHYAIGDLKPKSTVGGQRYMIEPIIYGFAEEYDSTPPYLRNLSPAASSVQNPSDGYVAMDIVDADTGVDGSSMRVYADGTLVYSGLTNLFSAPFDSILSTSTYGTYDGYDGYRIIMYSTSIFQSYQTILMHAYAIDNASNILDSYYTFRIEDYDIPVVTNISPAHGTENVDENTLISFDMYDVSSGLDLSSFRVSVAGMDAYDGYTFVTPFDGPSSNVTPVLIDGYDGYHVVIDAINPYDSAERIHVSITIDDMEGN